MAVTYMEPTDGLVVATFAHDAVVFHPLSGSLSRVSLKLAALLALLGPEGQSMDVLWESAFGERPGEQALAGAHQAFGQFARQGLVLPLDQ